MHAKLQIKNSPSVYVHLAATGEELLKNVSTTDPRTSQTLAQFSDSSKLAGLTVSTTEPAVHVFLNNESDPCTFKRALLHETVHAVNSILRWRIRGSIESDMTLITSEGRSVEVYKEMPALPCAPEEEQADLVAILALTIAEVIGIMRKDEAVELVEA